MMRNKRNQTIRHAIEKNIEIDLLIQLQSNVICCPDATRRRLLFYLTTKRVQCWLENTAKIETQLQLVRWESAGMK